MGYRTVNVRPETYERLRLYRVGGASLDSVLNRLMDRVEPSRFYEDQAKIVRRRVREARRGKVRPASELFEEFEDE